MEHIKGVFIARTNNGMRERLSWSAPTLITNDQRTKAFAREYLAPTKLPGTNDFHI